MNKKNGFTMIEVILVLAVAGVIFTAAFIALPNLWASERDATRREDVMKFVTQLKNFQTNNNRGALPGGKNEIKKSIDGGTVALDRKESSPSNQVYKDATSWESFYKDFFTDDFQDPDGYYYNLEIAQCAKDKNTKIGENCTNNPLDGSSGVDYNLYVYVSATCRGDSPIVSSSNRNVAVVYKLERAGQYCYNS